MVPTPPPPHTPPAGDSAPSPRTRPVLLFDGDCAFCTRTAELIERWIKTSATVVPWQFADIAALGVARSRAEREVVWVDPAGRTAGGAQAVARLLLDAGRGWAVLGALLRVPPFRWVARLVYVVVAANRHRLPGGTPACALPPAERPGGTQG